MSEKPDILERIRKARNLGSTAPITWNALTDAETEIQRLRTALSEPIPMILFCPSCGVQHIDAPDERTPDWANPPHKSHLCHGCGHIWRPCDRPTEGVKEIQTSGKADSPKLIYPNLAELLEVHKRYAALEQAIREKDDELGKAQREYLLGAQSYGQRIAALEAGFRSTFTALDGLLAFMSRTVDCDVDGEPVPNGVSIEEAHTSSMRFHAAVTSAIEVCEKAESLLSAPDGKPEVCANCGHANPHDGPAGAVDDACTFPGCNCGYGSMVPDGKQSKEQA